MTAFIPLASWAKNITGQRFGRLVARGPVRADVRGVGWLCSCDCGKTKIVAARQLLRGVSKSCGCLRTELNRTPKKHGACATPEYRAWSAMRQRCENPGNHAFDRYGGRGISIDPRWSSFEAFLADMGPCPKGHTLERRDNAEGYGPDNCLWATPRTQANNRRSNVVITYQGETRTLAEWIRHMDLPGDHSLYLKRWNAGWSPERIFSTPSRKKGHAQRDASAPERQPPP